MATYGFLYSVPVAEFDLLLPLSLDELIHQTARVRADLSSVENWLGNPPPRATEKEIQSKLVLWDTCAQWLCAYEVRLAAVRRPSGGAAGGASSAPPARDFSVLLEPRTKTSILGAACEICDSHFSCDCIREKVAAQMAAEKRQADADRAAARALIRQGKCACHLLPEEAQDHGEYCSVCQDAMCPDCERIGCPGGCVTYSPADNGADDDEDDRSVESEGARYARWEREFWESGH